MAAASRYVSELLGDFTEALNRRASIITGADTGGAAVTPTGNDARPRQGWLQRREGGSSGSGNSTGGVAIDASTSHLPRMSKSITHDEEMRAKMKPKSHKLGTFSGVFVPTTLNVLSILMFLRFGFILGQSGVLGMMGMLIASYLINLVTTLSISAISTNGTVRGGGAYYLISRSLGPEFGGSIGIVFYLGYVLNTGMNAVGLVDCIMNNYGVGSEDGGGFLPDSFAWRYLYATGVLVFCTVICLLGSGIFSKASNLLLIILLAATFSVPVSTLFIKPIYESPNKMIYSGLSWNTLKENFLPHFVKGAAGSESDKKETYQSLFGILFPATGGIFAGASMSGDLHKPSRAIPKGTLYGLLLTFVSYTLVIFAMGASIKRTALYTNLNIIQDVNGSAVLILMGEFATSFFSALMGVIGSAKLLQALARDNIVPGFSMFSQGTVANDEPLVAILFTFLLAQLTLLANINQIASVVTMTYLMTFLATNLACFLLKISSAPNFRPSFHYFRWWTAGIGTIISGITMFFVDGVYASACVSVLVFLFLLIHYTSPPKAWGDVSQSLIYHQVRKYLLRLRQENHIKFWRPQLLLFVNDPRRSYNLIQFCNSLKKGGLYILAHVIVTPDFRESFPEAKKQQAAWLKYIDFGKCKAFAQLAISPTVEWGMRNIVLSAGLGGMRPNIAIMGLYNLDEYRKRKPLIDLHVPEDVTKDDVDDSNRGQLPTDTCRIEQSITPTSWVNILEDMLMSLRINVALAKGFKHLEIPKKGEKPKNGKKYIDLWPIQMSAHIAAESHASSGVVTTNFDTYTLILQLGCILNTVPSWKHAYKLRVIVFVEYESDVEEERGRLQSLLENLRIPAEVVVSWLAKGDLKTYETIVNGKPEGKDRVESVVGGQDWWMELERRRREAELHEALVPELSDLVNSEQWPQANFLQQGKAVPGSKAQKIMDGFRKFVRKRKRTRGKNAKLQKLGVSLGAMNMRTHAYQPGVFSETESSSSSEDDDSDSDSSSSTESAASLNDADDYKDDSGSDVETWDENGRRVKFDKSDPPSRRASIGGGILLSNDEIARFAAKRKTSSKFESQKAPSAPPRPKIDILQTSPPPSRGESTTAGPSTANTSPATTAVTTPAKPSLLSPITNAIKTHTGSLRRPELLHRSTTPTFTSQKIPRTQVAEQESDTGPTIMFADQDTPSREEPASGSGNGGLGASNSSRRANGYPEAQAAPLSFNDLPSVAQHLILNELIRKYSEETAVVFTTLPSPLAGTYKSEEGSVEYITGLDVLCHKLPPVLLVHSNSMTVTMAL